MSFPASAGNGRATAIRRRRLGWLLLPAGVALLGSVSCGRTEPSFGAPEQENAASSGRRNAVAGAPGGGRAAGGRGSSSSGGAASGGQSPVNGGTGTAGSGGASVGPAEEVRLRGAPLVFAPTAGEIGVNVALASGDPAVLRARARRGGSDWLSLEAPVVRASDVAEWRLSGLDAGTSYEYQIVDAHDRNAPVTLYSGRGVTQRSPGTRFGFALLSDTHIGSDLSYSNQGDETVLTAVGAELGASSPDFVINLGDILDFHQFGFNDPPPSAAVARLGFLNYREAFGDALGNLGHFGVIGNWDGENGSFTSEEISRSRSQRLLYLPSPGPTTYPEGGAAQHDYYSFSWGDALFVVLNVMSYTTEELLLSTTTGRPEDWTLGNEQLAWLEKTLQSATTKWRFLFIHHAVGGAAGDEADSIYGRGGGLAAHVGEQAKVHQLMLDYGVQIFFYGHDHVFADMVVDGLHYTTPGNAGAIWTFPGSQTGYTRYWDQSGWARVDVSPDDVHVQFIAVGGQLLYDYTLP
jgi:hypothetical protein